jgi:L-malate glycosyltransferase
MRIAHISTQRGWNGGEQQAYLLIEGLARRAHETLIVARPDGEFARRMSAAGYHVAPFSGGGRGPRAVWQIRRHLASWRPDVVHFHDAHALSGGGLAAYGLPLAARIAARKVVFPVRQGWRYTRLADRVICVSQAARDCCLAGGMPTERLRVVHDGVDPARIAAGDRNRGRSSLGVGPAERLLLSIGSLSETKGHRYLLAALPAILQRYPDVRVALAGEGELRPSLQQQITELGLERAVQLLGYRPDVPDLVHAADLFVLPSLLEGMCSTLVDVMLARRPIVATAVGGVPEVLGADSGDLALARLVPPRDARSLAAAVCETLDQQLADLDPQLMRAEQRALDRFTAHRMVDGTLAVYREVLAARVAA